MSSQQTNSIGFSYAPRQHAPRAAGHGEEKRVQSRSNTSQQTNSVAYAYTPREHAPGTTGQDEQEQTQSNTLPSSNTNSSSAKVVDNTDKDFGGMRISVHVPATPTGTSAAQKRQHPIHDLLKDSVAEPRTDRRFNNSFGTDKSMWKKADNYHRAPAPSGSGLAAQERQHTIHDLVRDSVPEPPRDRGFNNVFTTCRSIWEKADDDSRARADLNPLYGKGRNIINKVDKDESTNWLSQVFDAEGRGAAYELEAVMGNGGQIGEGQSGTREMFREATRRAFVPREGEVWELGGYARFENWRFPPRVGR